MTETNLEKLLRLRREADQARDALFNRIMKKAIPKIKASLLSKGGTRGRAQRSNQP